MTDEFERDRLDYRRRAIVAAARSLFIEQGYERTTLRNIVDHAGGSLSTVYKLFGNKNGLLDAVVSESAVSGENLIREAASCGLPPVDILHRIAQDLHAQSLDPDIIALARIVIARSIEDVEFAHSFFERTATRTRDALELLFERWKSQGMAMTEEPGFLAEVFLGLIVSDLQIEAISHGVGTELPASRRRTHTEFFLRGAGFPSSRKAIDALISRS